MVVPKLRFREFGDEWEESKLGSLTEALKDGTHASFKDDKSGDHYLLSTKNIKNGKLIINDDERTISLDDFNLIIKSFKPIANDILLTIVGTIGRTLIFDGNTKIAFQRSVAYLRFKDKDIKYFNSLFQTSIFQNKLKQRTSISAQPGVYLGDLKRLQIMYSSNHYEQQKIGQFFTKLDQLINLQTDKVTHLKQLKRGYLQKLFTKQGKSIPELRFKEFDSNKIIKKRLRKLLNKNSLKNNSLYEYVESVSNKSGFIKQTDQFNDYSVASKDLSNYYVIKPRMFAYNPSRINVGSIAYKNKNDQVSVVSPLYVSFSTKDELNDGYLWNWFKTVNFEKQRKTYSEGGVRDTLSFNQLSNFNIYLPSLKEQQKIGQLFSTLDHQIELQAAKLTKLKQLKNGYLQKMFI